ncbi:transporter [Spirochaetia bacterium]|nr:transporter [Spirochaetia bacterium]
MGNPGIADLLSGLETLAIRIGRWIVIPLLVFSLTMSLYELREEGRFIALMGRSILLLVGVDLFVIAIGIVVTMIFPMERIPIIIQEQSPYAVPDTIRDVAVQFPHNMFAILVGDATFLLPVCIFSFFLGIGLSIERTNAKAVITLIDSLSRIFYAIAGLFSEIVGILIIIFAASWTFRFYTVTQLTIFRNLMLSLAILGGILGLVVFPLCLYLTRSRVHPWKVLYGTFACALAGFFSGDINMTLPVMFRHSKESLGIRRCSNTVTLTLFAMFGRAGSALVAMMAFMVIVKSYSSLELPQTQLLAIALRTILVSFSLALHPGDGAYVALTSLCQQYGRGYEGTYLVMKPMAFYLVAVGTCLDILIAVFASYAIAKKSALQENRKISQFI